MPVLERGAVVGRAIDFAVSPYPPSFDNSPLIFGWALFARLLVFTLAAATLVRIQARNSAEGLPANHPVFYHRAVTVCFLWALMLGAGSDSLTYLFWGEVSNQTTAVILLVSRLMDALTMVPFLMALFVPLWLRWLCVIGVLRSAPSITLNGIVNDVRVTWDSASLPIRLAVICAAASAVVTVGKYWVWVEHGRP